MSSGNQGVAFAAAGFMFLAQGAHAWYGPICYSDRTTQLVLTIPSISGETPGDLKVDFDDNDGKVKLGAVRASTIVKNAHEVVLSRDAESHNGIFAVLVTSPRSTTGYKFELEFRKDASECAGAIIKVTDRPGGGVLARSAPAGGVTMASAPARTRAVRAPKPKVALASAPAAESGGSEPASSAASGSAASGSAASGSAASGSAAGGRSEAELRPLPTPSAGSEAPAIQEREQQAGQAYRQDAHRSDSTSADAASADAGAYAPSADAAGADAAGADAPSTDAAGADAAGAAHAAGAEPAMESKGAKSESVAEPREVGSEAPAVDAGN